MPISFYLQLREVSKFTLDGAKCQPIREPAWIWKPSWVNSTLDVVQTSIQIINSLLWDEKVKLKKVFSFWDSIPVPLNMFLICSSPAGVDFEFRKSEELHLFQHLASICTENILRSDAEHMRRFNNSPQHRILLCCLLDKISQDNFHTKK